MNELMICFGKCGYAYHNTDCDDVIEAVEEFFECMKAMLINVDNLDYSEAVLRDNDGNDIAVISYVK